jgi:AcrR family transcriptional regulator
MIESIDWITRMSTKDRILDTAERLFAEQGIDATSLRQIIGEADVNLAAIHYHFGSKDDLLAQVIARKAEPVNQKRLALLDQLLARKAPQPLSIEEILYAFMAPMAEVAEQNPQFVRVMGRIHAEGLMASVVARHFQAIIARFSEGMRRALPDLPAAEFVWRVHFMVGAMAHTMCVAPFFPGIPVEPGSFNQRIDRLIAFVSAGFRAPVPQQCEQLEVKS